MTLLYLDYNCFQRSFDDPTQIRLVCAVYVKTDILVTCDDRFLKQARRLNLSIEIINPIDYFREE